jgi:hypothetical protein
MTASTTSRINTAVGTRLPRPYTRVACASDKPFLRLLVRHDDADREFADTAGDDSSLEQADRDDWTVVSMKNDWATVF